MNKTIVTMLLVAACLLSAGVAAQDAALLPRLQATTLNGDKVTLPDPAHYDVIILVLGFSHKSADQTEAWTRRIAQQYSAQARVAYFEVPELQGVPGMVKPMILHGMRREVPSAQQPHFAPIYEHEQELKKLVGFHGDADAYIVVAKPDGAVVWQTHGPVSDAGFSALVKAVSSTLSQ